MIGKNGVSLVLAPFFFATDRNETVPVDCGCGHTLRAIISGGREWCTPS